jgi:hypothetical protein
MEKFAAGFFDSVKNIFQRNVGSTANKAVNNHVTRVADLRSRNMQAPVRKFEPIRYAQRYDKTTPKPTP